MKKKAAKWIDRVFDQLESIWESEKTHAITGWGLVLVFISSLAVIELNRNGLLPAAIETMIPTNHFYAVGFVFNLLLIIEIVSLVFNLSHSISEALGKQFEILSLILLRSSFKEFVHFSEPIVWNRLSEPVMHILSDSIGALVIFILLGLFYHLLKHQPITRDEEEQSRFISSKKLAALLLLTIFIIIGLEHLWSLAAGLPEKNFFASFYTILIFVDILIVLISLRYTYRYCTLFRNSGFALTTVVIRLALTAPPYVNVILGAGAAVFAVGLTFAYNIIIKDTKQALNAREVVK